MARSRKRGRGRRSARGPRSAVARHIASEASGVTLIALALLAAIALASYSPADPVFQLVPVDNRAGALGATLAALIQRSLGWGGVAVILVLATLGVRLLLGRGLPSLASRFWWGALLLLLSLATLPPLLHGLVPERFPPAAGALGDLLASGERTLLSSWGALVLSGLLLVLAVLSLTGFSAGAALAAAGAAGGSAGRIALRAGAAGLAVVRRVASRASRLARGLHEGVRVRWERRARRARVDDLREQEALGPELTPGIPLAPAAPRVRRSRGAPDIVDHDAERLARRRPTQETLPFAARSGSGEWQAPDLSIFQVGGSRARGYDRDSLIMNSRILEKKLRDFGVLGRVLTVHPGPVITMYEFEPASGIKVNRIVSLADDLALALRALSVRIIAPLPGKSVVGIEVPNPEREVVYIRDLLDSPSFRASDSKLTMALGKDTFGNPVEADLARMPHLLVAGATGTGKSVFLNTLLTAVLFRATPDELRLLLIDPKVLELSIYEGIPHLIADVVTNPKRAAAALAGVVHKMDERYQMMAALGVRNISQFNDRVDELVDKGEESFRLRPKPGEELGGELPLERMAYIVVVIDELADLMVVSARDVEESLQRLAQMARAAGIHLVLATQRPSVDVLTGVIKANFPSRISFQVSSRTDSRTILDQNGAEHLLGQGDMLFLPPGTSKTQRLHGAYVSEKEVTELVAFLRDQGAPVFDETLVRLREESERREERGEDVDEMYDRAIALVTETRNASISHLQRRLKVGYNRAARMIEQMEEQGIVGPQDGTRPRDVYARALGPE